MRNKNKICGLTIAALASTVTALAADHVTGSPNQQSEIDLLSMPSDIAIGKDGCIYVLDSKNFKVQKYSSVGKYLFTFGGSRGQGPGEFGWI